MDWRTAGRVDPRRLELLRRWSTLLDGAFGVPGTRIRFGLDAVLGLLPGIGDLVTPVFSAVLLAHAVRAGVPRVVQFRMLVNALVDAAVGFVPIVGDVFDVAWKANLRNVELIERHSRGDTRPTAGDWVFLYAVLAGIVAISVAPAVILVMVLRRFAIL